VGESQLIVEHAEYALDQDLSLDKATRRFFQFWRSLTAGNNRHILEDCHFIDLHIPVYVEDWPEQPGPAHPGVFGDVFPAILSQLIGRDNILALHIKSSDAEYFDELSFIRDVLAPRHAEYVLLPSRLDPKYPTENGNLFFQWPSDSLQYIVDNWFMSPQIEIEGYLSRRPCLGSLAEFYFEPYGAQNIRKVLELLELGFRLWRDNNGLFIISDKLGEGALRARMVSSDLEAAIGAAAKQSEAGSPRPSEGRPGGGQQWWWPKGGKPRPKPSGG